MKVHKAGIIMNGVTGRMGTNQHLMRSIVEIIRQGGVKINESEYIMPDPILVGRNEYKLKKLADMSGVSKWTTNIDVALNDPDYQIYFDAQTTGQRAEAVKNAVKAGKHIYCEKPTATNTATAPDPEKRSIKRLCVTISLLNSVPRPFCNMALFEPMYFKGPDPKNKFFEIVLYHLFHYQLIP